MLTAANVFEAKSGSTKRSEYLEAVSVGIADADTNYSVQIYTGLKDVSNPYSGTKALSHSGTWPPRSSAQTASPYSSSTTSPS